MKRFLLSLLIILTGVSAAMADGNSGARKRQWLDEMRQLRTNYVVKQLDLTSEQREKFVPLYDAMSRELEAAMRDTRKMYKEVQKKGEAATSVELEKAAEASYECRGKESAIQLRYLAKFKAFLTPRQIFKLPAVELKFHRELIKHKKNEKK